MYNIDVHEQNPVSIDIKYDTLLIDGQEHLLASIVNIEISKDCTNLDLKEINLEKCIVNIIVRPDDLPRNKRVVNINANKTAVHAVDGDESTIIVQTAEKITTCSGDVKVKGNVIGDIKTDTGDVKAKRITGDVNTETGDVEAGEINGNVSTNSGDVKAKKGITGNASTNSGDIYEK